MNTGPRTSAAFVHLDMARGLAALLVLLAHLRQFIFFSYGELASHGPLEMVVWGVTGFGYQAVMIFFVLSGFFITRSIVMDERIGKFSWKIYIIKRLTRLWVVLIPCLIATVLWDSLSSLLTGQALGAELGLTAFIKNLLFLVHGASGLTVDFLGYDGFLQKIAAPAYGSNAPLWSLTNEFWYYMMFPSLYFLIRRPLSWSAGATFVGIFIAACAFVGESIGLYGLIWLTGAVSYLAYDWGRDVAKLRTSRTFAATVGLLAALVVSKMPYGTEFTKNMLVGLAAAPFVLALANCKCSSELYRRSARVLANASYTIYLAHFPFLVLLANVFIRGHRFSNSPAGYAAFVGMGAVVLVYCFGMYWLFERHTAKVRDYCLDRFRKATVDIVVPVADKG
jgi:peptidoglycan/LPS O-acetylase OafA/YrhL